MKLDIACGQRKQEGFIGVDVWPGPDVDVVWDLTRFPWPFDNDSVDEAVCSHYVEHTPDLIKFMNELHRIMKPGASAIIICPYYTSYRAFMDPTHTRFISEMSFFYFDKEWRQREKLDHYPITADFEAGFRYITEEEITDDDVDFELAVKHDWNVVNDIMVQLVKR